MGDGISIETRHTPPRLSREEQSWAFNLYARYPSEKFTCEPIDIELAKPSSHTFCGLMELANFARLRPITTKANIAGRRTERGRSRSLGEFSHDWEKLSL